MTKFMYNCSIRHSNGISHNWTRIQYIHYILYTRAIVNVKPEKKKQKQNGMQRENIWLFKCVFIYKFSKPLSRFIIILCAFQEAPCLYFTIFPFFFLSFSLLLKSSKDTKKLFRRLCMISILIFVFISFDY